MDLPLAIHKDQSSIYGVTIPDVPGCYSWGDTIDDAIRNARDAIYSHFETSISEGEALPDLRVSKIENLMTNDEFAGRYGRWSISICRNSIPGRPVSISRFPDSF